MKTDEASVKRREALRARFEGKTCSDGLVVPKERMGVPQQYGLIEVLIDFGDFSGELKLVPDAEGSNVINVYGASGEAVNTTGLRLRPEAERYGGTLETRGDLHYVRARGTTFVLGARYE